METKRAKAFAVMGAIGLGIVLAMHLLLSQLGMARIGAAWAGFYTPWLVFLITGLVGLKLRQGDSA